MRAAAQAGVRCSCCSSTCRCRSSTASASSPTLVRERRPVPMPAVVFVTAHDEYALRAFDAHAIDYLLKPFSDERFRPRSTAPSGTSAPATRTPSCRRCRRCSTAWTAHRQHGPPAGAPPRRVRSIDRREGVPPRAAAARRADQLDRGGRHVREAAHARRRAHLHRALLGSLDDALDRRRFVRIHRSAIVNIDWSWSSGRTRTATMSRCCGIGRRSASDGGFAPAAGAARAADMRRPASCPSGTVSTSCPSSVRSGTSLCGGFSSNLILTARAPQ